MKPDAYYLEQLERREDLRKHGPLEHLKSRPKHPLVKGIRWVDRIRNRMDLFWFLPEDLRREALRRYDKRMRELELIYPTGLKQIQHAGVIGGITKALLYPEQQMRGERSVHSARAKRGALKRWLNKKRESQYEAMRLQEAAK